MNYYVTINLGEYHSKLGADIVHQSVAVHDVSTTYHKGHEYTVIRWEHDGTECIDVYETTDGHTGVFVHDENNDEEIFRAVYASTTSCLRIRGEIPEDMAESYKDMLVSGLAW